MQVRKQKEPQSFAVSHKESHLFLIPPALISRPGYQEP